MSNSYHSSYMAAARTSRKFLVDLVSYIFLLGDSQPLQPLVVKWPHVLHHFEVFDHRCKNQKPSYFDTCILFIWVQVCQWAFDACECVCVRQRLAREALIDGSHEVISQNERNACKLFFFLTTWLKNSFYILSYLGCHYFEITLG